MHYVRNWYPALFSPATNNMQVFIWQRDIVGLAEYIMSYFHIFGALPDAPDGALPSSSSALTAGQM